MRYIPNIILSCGIMILSAQFIGNLFTNQMEKSLLSFLGMMICIGLLAILTEVQKLVK